MLESQYSLRNPPLSCTNQTDLQFERITKGGIKGVFTDAEQILPETVTAQTVKLQLAQLLALEVFYYCLWSWHFEIECIENQTVQKRFLQYCCFDSVVAAFYLPIDANLLPMETVCLVMNSCTTYSGPCARRTFVRGCCTSTRPPSSASVSTGQQTPLPFSTAATRRRVSYVGPICIT